MILKILFKNSFIIAAGTMISRALGYIRESLIAAYLGTGSVSDALIISTRIPTLFRKIASEGPFNSVLIPFIKKISKENSAAFVNAFLKKILIIFSAFLALIILFQMFFAEYILAILSPGTLQNKDQLNWFLKFIPFMSCTIIFYFFNGFFSAILNYNKKFFWPAFASVFWNIAIIILIFTAQKFNYNMEFIGAIFLIASIIQAISTLIPYLKLNIKSEKADNKKTIQNFFKQFFPIIFSTSVSQINTIILLSLASILPTGNITALHRSDRILQIPISLIIALNTSLLTTLIHFQDKEKYLKKVIILSITLISLPITLLFYFFNFEIAAFIFHHGKNTVKDISKISDLIKIYSFGIPAFLLIKVMPTFFFAQNKTKVAARGALIQTILSVFFSLILINKYSINAFAYASIISWIGHFLYLSFHFTKESQKQ